VTWLAAALAVRFWSSSALDAACKVLAAWLILGWGVPAVSELACGRWAPLPSDALCAHAVRVEPRVRLESLEAPTSSGPRVVPPTLLVRERHVALRRILEGVTP